MDKYISQQDVLSTYCADCCIDCGDSMCADWNKIRKWISNIPAADVAPVVHGRLIKPNPFGNCSVCGFLIDIRDYFNYCPNCGAKMDLKERDNEKD